MIKKIHMFLVLFGVLSIVTGAPVEVSNLRVNQRQPWNGKVNIDFVLGGDIEGAEYKVWLYCYDEIGKKSVPINTVRYDGQGEIATEFFLRAGEHRLVWDADVDAPGQVYQNVTINVDAELHSHSDAYTSQYVIIDLSGGAEASSYPISILNNVPEGGWTDEYKTTKLVLRKCPKGRDPTDASAYEISKEFYAGVFEVTQKQWELVMGTNPSHFSGDTKPVESVSYDMIRGVNKGAQWPANSEVDEDSFFGRLRAKTGFVELDLPTKAQGEYACRAGTKTTYYTGNAESDLTRAGWYRGNNANAGGSHILPSLGGIYRDTHKVGELESNSWGFMTCMVMCVNGVWTGLALIIHGQEMIL